MKLDSSLTKVPSRLMKKRKSSLDPAALRMIVADKEAPKVAVAFKDRHVIEELLDEAKRKIDEVKEPSRSMHTYTHATRL